jgi:hypothetical protein
MLPPEPERAETDSIKSGTGKVRSGLSRLSAANRGLDYLATSVRVKTDHWSQVWGWSGWATGLGRQTPTSSRRAARGDWANQW